MSQFFRKGGIALNDTEWIQDFADRRLQYGVSQTKLAVMAGISREHLSRIESGKVAVTEEMKVKLLEALEKFNPEAPLTMLFDYVRIRFPTLDIGHIIKDILQLNIQYMIHEDFGHYSYTEHYYIGDIFVYTSPDEEKGVLLELKGKGCRQFESYLLAQERSWYDFLMDALVDGGVMKRLDLAINDHTGMLDIPELTEKCRNEECVSVFRSFKSYASGELVKHEEQDKAGMGYAVKATSVTVIIIFGLSLYLGYGMMLRLPVGFLPTYQIRIVVSMKTFFQPIAILVGCIWSGILVLLSWIKFCKCDFK